MTQERKTNRLELIVACGSIIFSLLCCTAGATWAVGLIVADCNKSIATAAERIAIVETKQIYMQAMLEETHNDVKKILESVPTGFNDPTNTRDIAMEE